ncbi:Hypothetical predicted protein [Olea europaea subsp. europaea]|uniref:Uncharacterized protein n=1 Tax=Olea europaea subsp. europaea TaxID=158383 RepID=A0A8S0UJ08_OLEEU|nr:Hypothetical predicted protein [Olea europaea subsp. europaea]
MLSVARATVTELNLEAEGDVQSSYRGVDYISIYHICIVVELGSERRSKGDVESTVEGLEASSERDSEMAKPHITHWHFKVQTERAHWRREAFAVCQMPIGGKWISILAFGGNWNWIVDRV